MVAVVDRPELERFPKGWGSVWITQSRFQVPHPSARFQPSPGAMLGAGGRGGRRAAYRLHGVVHRQEGLQALPLQHVGELHVDRLHGPRVTHDPVLVRVGRVVVARGAGGQMCTEVRPGGGQVGVLGPAPPQGPPPSMPRGKSSCAGAAAQAEASPLWTPACRGLCPTFGQHLCVQGMHVGRPGGHSAR